MSEQPLVFIGSYSPADKPGIHVYSFNEDTGELTPFTSYTGIENPSFLVVHPDGKWFYAVQETGNGGVAAFHFDRDARAIQFVNKQLSGGDYPCHLTLDDTGKWLFVANYGTGSARVFPIRDDGSLGERSAHVEHQGTGPNTSRQERAHAHSTTITPDNRFAIVADLGIDKLVMYAFDATNGTLQLHGHGAAQPGAGPRHLAFHPNGRVLYAANELSNTVSVYDYNAANGTLTERHSLDTLPPDAPEDTVADIHLSHDADRVYVSNRGHNSIAVFAANSDGQLERLAIVSCGGEIPRNFALSPDEKFLLAANQNSGEVCVLPLDQGGAEIGAPLLRIRIPGACCLKFL